MELKVFTNGSVVKESAKAELIKEYSQFFERISKLKDARDQANNEDVYKIANREWLEVANEFIGFQKCLAALDIQVKRVKE